MIAWGALALGITVVVGACGGGGGVPGAVAEAGDGGGGGLGPCILTDAEVVDALGLSPAEIEATRETEAAGSPACVYEGTLRYRDDGESVAGALTISVVVYLDAEEGADVLDLTRNDGEPVDIGDDAAVSSNRAIMRLDGQYFQVNFRSETKRSDESGSAAILGAIASKLGR